MNVIVWLVFELTFYNVTVQYISHYTMGTPPSTLKLGRIMDIANHQSMCKDIDLYLHSPSCKFKVLVSVFFFFTEYSYISKS